ncbi:hypothetical protein LCGC14_1088870, partial [marine sediment metagenome]
AAMLRPPKFKNGLVNGESDGGRLLPTEPNASIVRNPNGERTALRDMALGPKGSGRGKSWYTEGEVCAGSENRHAWPQGKFAPGLRTRGDPHRENWL